MKKFLVLILIVLISPVLGGLYGILHDQLSYTISPEYYTKFKFQQFGLVDSGNEAIPFNPRMAVSIVGLMATWWMGLLIALILGFVGLVHQDHRIMLRVTIKATIVTTIIAFLTGLIGLAYGKFYLSGKGVNWWLPENLEDTKSFISVGSMHNFSYLGGVFGVVGGIIYSLNHKKSNLKEHIV